MLFFIDYSLLLLLFLLICLCFSFFLFFFMFLVILPVLLIIIVIVLVLPLFPLLSFLLLVLSFSVSLFHSFAFSVVLSLFFTALTLFLSCFSSECTGQSCASRAPLGRSVEKGEGSRRQRKCALAAFVIARLLRSDMIRSSINLARIEY